MTSSASKSKDTAASDSGAPVIFYRNPTLDLAAEIAAESNTPPEKRKRLLEMMREDARRLTEALLARRWS